MNQFPKRQLLVHYLLGICTPEEQQEVERWLDQEPGNVSLLQQVAKELGEERTLSSVEKKDLKKGIFDHIDKEKSTRFSLKTRWKEKEAARPSVLDGRGLWLKAAAMLLVIFTAGAISLYYSDWFSPESSPEVKLKERTLSNGEIATLRFADGSVIKLNAGSTLRYPEHFSGSKREIYLEGEAFFSVSKDTSRPFIVHAGGITTRVLGTAFNIKAYEDQKKLRVAVTEGQVAVSRSDGETAASSQRDKQPLLLKKNQWASYQPSGRLIEKGAGEVWKFVAWKDRVLVFDDDSLSHIARRLERWYNIEVILEDSSLGSRRMSASFKEESMTEVLTIIALSLDMSYEQEGRRIVFRKYDL